MRNKIAVLMSATVYLAAGAEKFKGVIHVDRRRRQKIIRGNTCSPPQAPKNFKEKHKKIIIQRDIYLK